jgi:hypothetical protein
MHSTINNLPVGRSVDETLRVLQAFQYVQSHPDEVCPANWTPGENLDHCAITFEIGLNGSGMKLGLVVRLVGRLLTGIITSDRPGAMRPGFKLPASAVELAPRPGVTFQEGMSRIRRAIRRLDAGERMTKPSPLLGALTHEQWVRLNLNHTQMHLGFLTYPGAPQQ